MVNFIFQFEITSTSPINIVTENNLSENNFKEWKRKLHIVLSCEKHEFVLDKTCPPHAQHEGPLKGLKMK